jgi:hypothetical protein
MNRGPDYGPVPGVLVPGVPREGAIFSGRIRFLYHAM